MNDITTLIDTHLAGYCEPDGEERVRLLASAWSADGVLIDPPFDGTGHAGIAAMVDSVLAHFPGHVFQRTTEVDTHHDHARYDWNLIAPNGDIAVKGTDFVELSAGGKIERIVGFFGDPTAKAL